MSRNPTADYVAVCPECGAALGRIDSRLADDVVLPLLKNWRDAGLVPLRSEYLRQPQRDDPAHLDFCSRAKALAS